MLKEGKQWGSEILVKALEKMAAKLFSVGTGCSGTLAAQGTLESHFPGLSLLQCRVGHGHLLSAVRREQGGEKGYGFLPGRMN